MSKKNRAEAKKTNKNVDGVKSLDPRVSRLPEISTQIRDETLNRHEQFETYEVFVQPKTGRPFQHEGSVHAPNLELAYVLAKETFTRRFTCSSIFVIATDNVHASPLTEGDQNVYDLFSGSAESNAEKTVYEVFHLRKRGKQHIQVGQVHSSSVAAAFASAKNQFDKNAPIFNVWVMLSSNIRYTGEEEADLWATLPEKKFRDATEYRGGDKLNEFLSRDKRS